MLVQSSIFLGLFVEYKVHYVNYQSNSSLTALEIENVTKIFENDTFEYLVWYINLNYSYYYPPGINYDSIEFPKDFLYIPNVGSASLNRSVELELYNITNGVYVYRGVQNLTVGDYIVWIIYVNSSGVPSRIFLYQYIGEELISNTTYVLLSSNLINPHASIYFPSNVTLEQGRSVPLYVGDIFIFSSAGRLIEVTIGIGAISIIVILLFRKRGAS
ncbi:hypothetical protein GFS03_01305 [Sulfolobus sp. E5-1-F]|nr:hypothetical protein [Sulfolobus sp. E5-1-F]QGA55473.1 hypothetical protein GFS03_01305 [Sulfolobus sp. E5-1-F]QGA69647.1 hypothetical protein GFS33_06505 [Sulfolobus sp. E11-6]